MKSNLDIVPEDEAEVRLMEKLVEVRSYANEKTELDKHEIALVFNSFANGMFIEGSNENVNTAPSCPVCGRIIEDVEVIALGVNPTVRPCGCDVEVEELPNEVRQDMFG